MEGGVRRSACLKHDHGREVVAVRIAATDEEGVFLNHPEAS